MSWAFAIALVAVVNPVRALRRNLFTPRLSRELEIWRWKRHYRPYYGRIGNDAGGQPEDATRGERRADAGVIYYGGRRGVLLRRR